MQMREGGGGLAGCWLRRGEERREAFIGEERQAGTTVEDMIEPTRVVTVGRVGSWRSARARSIRRCWLPRAPPFVCVGAPV
jgi:hypothetical protein